MLARATARTGTQASRMRYAAAIPAARIAPGACRTCIRLAPRHQPHASQWVRSMHDDFAPKSKVVPETSIFEQIQEQVDSNEVVLYMKGVPSAPQCGFSNMVVKILEMEGQ